MQIRVLKELIFTFSLLDLIFQADCKISCKSEEGLDIDWFINYKFPKLKGHEDRLVRKGEGYAYAYPVYSSGLTMSGESFMSRESMLGRTLGQFYDHYNHPALTYLLYNSDRPDRRPTFTSGASKGVVLFDGQTGVWLIHSIPEFPSVEKFGFPKGAYKKAQMVLCMSFKVSELNNIGVQLLFSDAAVYDSRLNPVIEEGLDTDVRSLFSSPQERIRSVMYFNTVELLSREQVAVASFAKHYKHEQDLYSYDLAPELKTSLYVQTNRKGLGEPIPASCEFLYTIQDVSSINITFTREEDGRKIRVAFPSSKDNSKWAVSKDVLHPWFCIGDLDRMDSEIYRSGGVICAKSKSLFDAFLNIIEDYDTC